MNTQKSITVGAITAALLIPAALTGAAQSASAATGRTPACVGDGTGATRIDGTGHGQQGNGAGMARRGGQGQSGGGNGAGSGGGNPLGTEPAGTLSAELKTELTYLAEEEKVAHDLYVLAYDTYGITTFSNISRSETRHFDIMNRLLALYGLPAASEMGNPGEFEDPALQDAYDALAARIQSSPAEALQVGIDVEKTDIADLKAALAMSPPIDVSGVLSNLIRASQQHLSAFQRSSGQANSSEVRVKAKAVQQSSRIRINVNPNSEGANYKMKVQKKLNGEWRTKRIVRTKGRADVKTVNVKAGLYRVKVPAQFGLTRAVSDRVQVTR